MNEVYHDSIDASNQELRYIIDELKEENKILKRKNSCERRLTDDRDRELANLKADLSEVRDDLATMTESRDYWIKVAEERSAMVCQFERKYLDRGEVIKAYELQVDSLKQLVEDRGDKIDELTGECESWEEDYDRLVLIRDQLQQELDELKKKPDAQWEDDCQYFKKLCREQNEKLVAKYTALKKIADTAQEAYDK